MNRTADGTATTILLVDDEPSIRSALRALLEPFDFCVLEARNLFEARRMAARTPPDIVVLDLRLPDGSGWELLDEIRKGESPDDRKTVLIFSAFADFSLALDAIAQGADACISKSENGIGKLLEAIWRETRLDRSKSLWPIGDCC